MKIVLHIGTHKTGTSALQSFCGLNREVLLARAVLYPRLANKSNSFNFLAARIAFGQADEVRRFFAETVKAAQRAHVGTILVSGESFYAMTSLFYRLYDRPCGDYWEHERRCVSELRTCLPAGVEYAIYCYVRRQDRFLESLYNQCVKHTPGFDGDITAFLGRMHETLDYTRQLEIWGEVFGGEALHVRSYESAAARLPENFLAWALNIGQTEGFSPLGARVNERLSRDLLEYKRILNRIELSRADAATAFVQVMELARIMGDNGNHHEYLSPGERQSLFERFAASNAKMVDRYPEAGSLILSGTASRAQAWTPYPGLSVEDALEITCRHLRLARQPKERLQSMLRRVYYPLRRRHGFVDVFVRYIRNLLRI
jgi:hypothetical protein